MSFSLLPLNSSAAMTVVGCVAAAIALASCTSPCQELADSTNGLQQKAAPCEEPDGGVSIVAPMIIGPQQVNTCQRECTRATDSSLLEAAARCYANVPVCEPGEPAPYVLGSIACSQQFQDLSAPCRGGVSGGDN